MRGWDEPLGRWVLAAALVAVDCAALGTAGEERAPAGGWPDRRALSLARGARRQRVRARLPPGRRALHRVPGRRARDHERSSWLLRVAGSQFSPSATVGLYISIVGALLLFVGVLFLRRRMARLRKEATTGRGLDRAGHGCPSVPEDAAPGVGPRRSLAEQPPDSAAAARSCCASCRTAARQAPARPRTAWRTPRGSAPRLLRLYELLGRPGQLGAGSASRTPRYGAPLSYPPGRRSSRRGALLAISFCTRSSCVQTTSSSLSRHSWSGHHACRGREVRARLLSLEREAHGRAVGRDLRELVSHVVSFVVLSPTYLPGQERFQRRRRDSH